MMANTRIKLISLIIFIGGFATVAGEPVNTGSNGLALKGYDPVAYFLAGDAVPGRGDLSAEFQGAVYHFSTQEHLDLFLADPNTYLPAFGGYCAWAVGQGYLADIDPEAWTVHEGRLYLNFSRGIRRRFNNGIEGHIAAADRRWPELSQ